MNKDNQFPAAVSRHPLLDTNVLGELPLYSREVAVVAVQADNPGMIDRIPFQAGDYIVTDWPVTKAWSIPQQVFESTYARIGSGFGPKIVQQSYESVSGVTEGLPKGLDVRGIPQQGQPQMANPGYAQEVRDQARRAAAAAGRAQEIRDRDTAKAAAKVAPKPRARRAAKR